MIVRHVKLGMTLAYPVVAFLLAMNGPLLSAAESADELAQAFTIYRDNWGVPHVDGPTALGPAMSLTVVIWRVSGAASRSVFSPQMPQGLRYFDNGFGGTGSGSTPLTTRA